MRVESTNFNPTTSTQSKNIDSNNMARRYKSLATRKYIKRVCDFFYDFDYETATEKYAYIKIDDPTAYYDGTEFQEDDFYDIFITDISKFRIFGTTKESEVDLYWQYKEKYYSDINKLNLTNNLKDYLKRSFGYHVSCGNFLSIEDIVFDVKTYDGKYIREKTPNLGKVKYDVLKEALVKAGYLSEEYLSPKKEKPQKIMVEVNSNNKELLIQFLQDNQFVYKEK